MTEKQHKPRETILYYSVSPKNYIRLNWSLDEKSHDQQLHIWALKHMGKHVYGLHILANRIAVKLNTIFPPRTDIQPC